MLSLESTIIQLYCQNAFEYVILKPVNKLHVLVSLTETSGHAQVVVKWVKNIVWERVVIFCGVSVWTRTF